MITLTTGELKAIQARSGHLGLFANRGLRLRLNAAVQTTPTLA